MGRHSKKRRYIRRTAAFKKSLVWGILIAAAVPGVLSTAVLYDHVRQSWDGLAADTAVLSAMYTVPDRAFEQLRERFAQPSDPQQPEQEQEKAQQPLIPPQRQEEQPPPTKHSRHPSRLRFQRSTAERWSRRTWRQPAAAFALAAAESKCHLSF